MLPRKRRAALTVTALIAAATAAVGTVPAAQAAPATPTCQAAGLSLSVGQEQGAAGSILVPVNFTNTSTRTCALRGFPGVSVLDVNHHQIGSPASRDGSPVTTVAVRPGRTVSATIRTNDAGTGLACQRTSDYLGIYPPAGFQQMLIPYRLQVCGVFETGPVQAAG
ncbi:hypothetical protein GCM10010430_54120 [Kitasatospora cystarginea]|uniref:DUF4232 domain-containing protein n=1 Tax=Kitasatospora cystarginea TaxID=58350 RepID=A0ABP5RKM9_9ACTN